jgi:CBS-domain-containing membrane protein
MDAAREQASFDDSIRPFTECGGIVDFAAVRLRDDTLLRDATATFMVSGLWGIPVVNDADQYVGTCTLRSIMASVLPAAHGIVSEHLVSGEQPGQPEQSVAERWRRERALRRPIGQILDLEVPSVRLSTALPRLLFVLCRHAPVVPIVSDSGRRLVGVASLDRALRALCAG